MVKGAVTYSKACKSVKTTAKQIVIIKEIEASFFDPAKIAWWAHVTEAPELKSKTVFSSGICQASRTVKYAGGQTPPKAGLGLKLE